MSSLSAAASASTRRVRLRSGAKSTMIWPPSPRSRSWRGRSRPREVGLERRRGREVGAGIHVDRDKRPRRLDGSEPRPTATGRRIGSTASQTPRLGQRLGASRTWSRVLGPVAPRLAPRPARAAGTPAGPRRRASPPSRAQRGDLARTAAGSAARQRTQDQAEVFGRAGHRGPASVRQRRAPAPARGSRGRHCGPARRASGSPCALQQDAVADRRRLAGLGPAR